MTRTLPRREQRGAWFLLLGTALGGLGLVWDVQWHTDVGPDTFFTAPHLVIYVGSALSGITALTVVLLTTRAAHAARYADGMPARTVLGVFRAPLPFLICGTGAAVGLLYGLTDLWWHTVFGFDATPKSPPHVAMSLISVYDAFGLMLAFITLRSTRSGRLGLVLAGPIALPGIAFLCYSAPSVLGVETVLPAIITTGILMLGVVAGALRRPGPLALLAAAFLIWQAVQMVYAPVVTRWYADSLGLGLRDFAVELPLMPMTLPVALPLAALLFAAAPVYLRRWSPRIVIPLLGAIAALVAMAGYLVVPSLQTSPGTVAIAVPCGALAAWTGWALGSLGRLESADLTTTPPAAPVATTRLAVSEG